MANIFGNMIGTAVSTALNAAKTVAETKPKTTTANTTTTKTPAASTTPTGNVYNTDGNGKAPAGLKAGDSVITNGGTYTITGVNPDGTYQSYKSSEAKTNNYSTSVKPNGKVYNTDGNGKAPPGLKVGDSVITNGGTYTITAVNPDGTYQSYKSSDAKTNNYPKATLPEKPPEELPEELPGVALPATPTYTPTNNSEMLEAAAAEYLKQQQEALKTAYETNVSNLDAEQGKLKDTYSAARTQEAADSALSRQRFNETAAAYGLNTGTSGQAQLSYANELQKELSTLHAAEAAANEEIERQRTNLAKEYQSAMVQAQAENNYQLFKQLYNEAVRMDEALQDQSQYNANLALQKYQLAMDKLNSDRAFDYQTSRDSKEDQLNAAALAAQMGDYSLYGKYYDWDDAFTNQLNQKHAETVAAKNAKSSGSGGNTTLKPGDGGGNYDALYADAQASGYPESYIANNYKRYGFTSATGLSDGYYDWDAQDAESGMNESYFNAFANSVSAQLAAGKGEAAVNNATTRWGSLSNRQKNQIQSLFSRYGYTYAED